jgi:hypothetical protein
MSPSASLSEEESAPTPVPRRRRTRSWLPFLGQEQRDHILDDLSERAFPRLDFFLLTLLAAFFFSLSYRFSSPVFLVVGSVFAPQLGPLSGAALGLATGSMRFAVRNLAALALVWILAFLFALGTAASLAFLPGLGEVFPLFDVLSAIVAVGASVWWIRKFLQGAADVWIPNAVLAYLCLYPLCAAGWMAAAGRADGTTAALLAWSIRSALILASAAGSFLASGFHPTERKLVPYLGIFFASALVILVIGAWIGAGGQDGLSVTISPTATHRPAETASPMPFPSRTPSATATSSPSPTPTVYVSPTPTPQLARIHGTGGDGAYLRKYPSLEVIELLEEGALIEILGPPVMAEGKEWIPVRTQSGNTGVIMALYCATLTPTPTLEQ